MGAISMAEMRMTRDERRQQEEDSARRAREAEWQQARIRESNRIRDERLILLTNMLIAGNATTANIDYILSELNAWKKVLFKVNASQAHGLVENILFFPKQIQETLYSILPILQLKKFTFSNNLVQRSELIRFLSLARCALNANSYFLTALSEFIDKTAEELLSDKQTLCLKRIVDDHQAGLFGSSNLVNDIVVSQLLATTTLSQLNPIQVITQGLSISVEKFSIYRDLLIQRITSLPLNADNRITLAEVILPGITTIIDDEQAIVDHVREHHGTLYYLNEKLPLHTDHALDTDPEEYRQTLRRLLINFFGAAEIAHTKGRLSQFCEKICSGYCFEGRVRDVFEWVATFSDVLSFHETMEKYFQKEYLPYAEIMAESSGHEVVLADPIIDFIMARHKNAACLHDDTYAPLGKFTQIGLKKYLLDIFGLVSQRECAAALGKTRTLRHSLERQCTFFWTTGKALKQTKIAALQALETRIETGTELPEFVAKDIKELYPVALQGYFSRTRKLLTGLEMIDSAQATNTI